MKTKTITKIEMTEEELFSFNNVFYTLINVRFDNNPTLKNAIEKEWKKNGIYLDVEAVAKALDIIVNMTEDVDTTE